MYFHENGIISSLEKKYLSNTAPSPCDDKNTLKAMSIQQIVGLFYIVGGLTLVGVIVIWIEIMYYFCHHYTQHTKLHYEINNVSKTSRYWLINDFLSANIEPILVSVQQTFYLQNYHHNIALDFNCHIQTATLESIIILFLRWLIPIEFMNGRRHIVSFIFAIIKCVTR